MAQLNISNVINIQVSESPSGLGEYNTSNVALFSNEAPADASEFADGYKIYLEPTEVGVDFGTDSDTYAMALALFSQRPNILANSGYLTVIPVLPLTFTLTASALTTAGTITLNDNNSSFAVDINWDDTIAEVQAAIRAQPGWEGAVVTGTPFNVGNQMTVKAYGYLEAVDFVIPGTFTGGISVTPLVTQEVEKLDAAITRTTGLVQYFGIMSSYILSMTDGGELEDAAAVVQALDKILFSVSRTTADIAGRFTDIMSANLDQTRCLFYGADTDQGALQMLAAYVGRALSTNFDGSNTTQTMHLKDLIGIDADDTMTQTILNNCATAGVDTYPSIQGVAKVMSQGANTFFDRVYNRLWFVGALRIAGFNFLAQSSTKVPQTEVGIGGLKGAYRKVCEQAVVNQYAAPGEWNSPNTFGNLQDLLDNVEQRGYYIYSQPVSQQSQAAREAREAPLIQIAIKEAGAAHSSNVIVNINA